MQAAAYLLPLVDRRRLFELGVRLQIKSAFGSHVGFYGSSCGGVPRSFVFGCACIGLGSAGGACLRYFFVVPASWLSGVPVFNEGDVE